MKEIEGIENSIKNLIFSGNLGKFPNGEISCDFGRGYVGHKGDWTSGLFKKERRCITELLDQLKNADGDDFSDLLFKLKKISTELERGPIYHFDIKFKGKKIDFKYFCTGDNFNSINELIRTNNDTLPDFIYERMFNEELISCVQGYEIEHAIFSFVPAYKARKGEVSEKLLNLYAVVDWQSDTDNGSLTQYFSRNIDCFGCYPRKELYSRVIKGLELLGYHEAIELFKDAVVLFSNFHKTVESTRKQLEIEPASRQIESDIDGRYFEIYDEIHKKLRSYVKEHACELSIID